MSRLSTTPLVATPMSVQLSPPRALPAPRTPFLLPAPADYLPDIHYLMSRQVSPTHPRHGRCTAHASPLSLSLSLSLTLAPSLSRDSFQPHDMLYYEGKMRPAAEIMAACCAMLGGYARQTQLLPAPEQPSTLSQLDHWARIESAILSPALQVVARFGRLPPRNAQGVAPLGVTQCRLGTDAAPVRG